MTEGFARRLPGTYKRGVAGSNPARPTRTDQARSLHARSGDPGLTATALTKALAR
jgi:hypothetical protein